MKIMSVNYELFLDWANKKFSPFNIKIRETAHGTEICTQSIWSEDKIGKTDTKYKLWMNPEKNKYRCWLTDNMGSLTHLVATLDNISYSEASSIIGGENTLLQLSDKIDSYFQVNPYSEFVEEKQNQSISISLPKDTFSIERLSKNQIFRIKAEKYLNKRNIKIDGLYICVSGDYNNRIIIPYYNQNKELIFYNGRTVNDSSLRYLKCTTSILKQDDVLYFKEYPCKNDTVYLMEGEFDAITLHQCGLIGCACGGKYLSDKQISLLKDYKIVLAFDADNAGLKATLDIGDLLLSEGFTNIKYVRPPKIYKDWNKLYVEKGESILLKYIERFTKNFTENTRLVLN